MAEKILEALEEPIVVDGGAHGITAGIGIIEWLVSAHRLWHGLHLTPEQAREQTRARSRKR